MKSHARVVVIGGGVVGVGTLYHLAKKGWSDVVLLERKELTSGSTWHAAGLLPLFNMSYSVGQVHKYSVRFYQELQEETGLLPEHVELLHSTPGWLRYRLPSRCVRAGEKPRCIGQKQVWFLLRFLGDDTAFSFDQCSEPEFCTFKCVDFWYPVDNVIAFKRAVYYKALSLLEPMAESRASADWPAQESSPA